MGLLLPYGIEAAFTHVPGVAQVKIVGRVIQPAPDTVHEAPAYGIRGLREDQLQLIERLRTYDRLQRGQRVEEPVRTVRDIACPGGEFEDGIKNGQRMFAGAGMAAVLQHQAYRAPADAGEVGGIHHGHMMPLSRECVHPGGKAKDREGAWCPSAGVEQGSGQLCVKELSGYDPATSPPWGLTASWPWGITAAGAWTIRGGLCCFFSGDRRGTQPPCRSVGTGIGPASAIWRLP